MTKKNRKESRRKPMAGLWFALLAIFLGELLFYTWCRVQCVRLGYDIAAETTRHERLTSLQSTLKTELARLKTPRRLQEMGHRLELIMPKTGQTIVGP
jgi:hypothetical protein